MRLESAFRIAPNYPYIEKMTMTSQFSDMTSSSNFLKFCSIFWDWDKLGVSNLAQMSLIKCYLMPQNTRVTAFTVFELLRENQQRGKISPTPTQIRDNHLKPRCTGFFNYIFKILWWDNAFNKKSENINLNDFQMIFASSTNVCKWWSHAIVQQ